jgi:hypothetical protein
MKVAPTAQVSEQGGIIRLPRPLWLVLVVVVLVIVGVSLRFGLPIYRQQVAINAIQLLGAKIKTRRTIPEWVATFVGEKWSAAFDDVVDVSLIGSRVTDADLVNLRCFPCLDALWLGTTPTTDAGLRHLRASASLRTLDASGTRITDAGMQHIRGMARLETLYIDDTQVTDVGLAELNGLISLRHLYYFRSHVSKKGIAALKLALPSLADD